jgi:hypothetical protein
MNPSPEKLPQEVLAGLVERVTYHNVENGFCVLKARGHRDIVTVVGHAATIAAGEWITASGEWVNDRTHGGILESGAMCRLAPPFGITGDFHNKIGQKPTILDRGHAPLLSYL